MALIIPKCNAEPETLDLTLQVYYDAKDWVVNSVLIDILSSKLLAAGIETEKKEPQSYTKKTQVLSYYGLIEWEDPSNTQSRRRISEDGIKFYELRQKKDKQGVQELLVEILSCKTFGRNVLGCDSDSDFEAPNVFIKSALLLGSLTNKEFAYIIGRLELNHWSFEDALFDVCLKKKNGIMVTPNDAAAKWADPKPIIALADWGLFDTQKEGNTKLYFLNDKVIAHLGDKITKLKIRNTEKFNPDFSKGAINDDKLCIDGGTYSSYLHALRTKPFMLLAGISGTGKSRIVRELAYKSCPKCLQQDETTPGNYLMVEVKPNWHDSSELLGYYSHLANDKNGAYIFTDFVKFLVKAQQYPEVPFFVCLDEMNLAPVEQYFAEFLSVLETRKQTEDGIKSGELVSAEYMKGLPNWSDGALTLPDNVFIIGTVNMDDTTHQFSRKVIDRAMTIEMNGGDLMAMFGGSKALEYFANDTDVWTLNQFQPKYVTADEVLEAHPEVAAQIQKDLPEKLEAINETLKDTPFQVSYRVLNEMVIYLGVLLESGKTYDEAVATAVDQITLMKILPRIEGDEDMFAIKGSNENKLEKLRALFGAETDSYKKLTEMNNRLKGGSGFTRFWP